MIVATSMVLIVAQQIGKPVKVVAIQEAGLDGFWLHRLLEASGIESHVVDPASIAVDRRKRRRKPSTPTRCCAR